MDTHPVVHPRVGGMGPSEAPLQHRYHTSQPRGPSQQNVIGERSSVRAGQRQGNAGSHGGNVGEGDKLRSSSKTRAGSRSGPAPGAGSGGGAGGLVSESRSSPSLFTTRSGVKTRVAVHQAAGSSSIRVPMAPVAVRGLSGIDGALGDTNPHSGMARDQPMPRALPTGIQNVPSSSALEGRGGGSDAASIAPSYMKQHSSTIFQTPDAQPAPHARQDSAAGSYGSLGASTERAGSRHGHRKGLSDATATSAGSSRASSCRSLSGTVDDTSDGTATTSTFASSSNGNHNGGCAPSDLPLAASGAATIAAGMGDSRPVTESSLTKASSAKVTPQQTEAPAVGFPSNERSQSLTAANEGYGDQRPSNPSTFQDMALDFGLFSSETQDLASTLGASFRSYAQGDASGSADQSSQARDGVDAESEREEDDFRRSKRDTITSLSELLKRSTSHASKRMTIRPDDMRSFRLDNDDADPMASSPVSTRADVYSLSNPAAPSATRSSRKPAPSLLDLDLSGAGPSLALPNDHKSVDSDPEREHHPMLDVAPAHPPRRSSASLLSPASAQDGFLPAASLPIRNGHARNDSSSSSYASSNKDLPPTPTSADFEDSNVFTPSSQTPFLKRSLSRLRPSAKAFPSSRSPAYAASSAASTSDLSVSAGSSFTSAGFSVSTKASGVSKMRRFVDKVRGVGTGYASRGNNAAGETVRGDQPPPKPTSRRRPSLSNLLSVFSDQSAAQVPAAPRRSSPTGPPMQPVPRRSFDMLRPSVGRRRTEETLVKAAQADPTNANSVGQEAPQLKPRRSFDMLRGKLPGARKSTDDLRASASMNTNPARGAVSPPTSSTMKTSVASSRRTVDSQTSPLNSSNGSSVPWTNPTPGARQIAPRLPSLASSVPLAGEGASTDDTRRPALGSLETRSASLDSRGHPNTSSVHGSEKRGPRVLDTCDVLEWDKLSASLVSSNTSRQSKIGVVTATLAPFLRGEEGRSNSIYLDQRIAAQHRDILFQWLDIVLGELQQSQPTSRGVCLEVLAAILESHFFSDFKLSFSASDAERYRRSLIDAERYRRSLIKVLKFAVDKLNDKAVYANILVFSGRMLALAFFRLEDVALKLLKNLPPVKRTSIKRVLDEIQDANTSNGAADVPLVFPDHLAKLKYADLTSYCRLFANATNDGVTYLVKDNNFQVEMSGNWLIRWTASDSDLPFAFYRSFYRQLAFHLPAQSLTVTPLRRLLQAPGFLFVTASFLDKCDSLVHRSLRSVTTLGPNSNNFNAGESANLAMGAKPKILELAHRRLVSTALEIVGGSPRADDDPDPAAPDAAHRRRWFGLLLNVWIRAIAKRTSMWDTRSVFLLFDLLDGLYYTVLYTAPFAEHDEAEQPPRLFGQNLGLFDFTFLREVLRTILTSADNTVCLMRTIAFVYAQFEALTARADDRDALCLGLLLDPPVFDHLFLHWNTGVRGYFLRLLVWRLSRIGTTADGQTSKSAGAVKILLTFNARLDAVRDRHDQLSPASDIMPDAEGYQAKRSTICSTRGVTDQPWAIDELPQGDTAEVVEESNASHLDDNDRGSSVPKVISWLKVVRRLGTGGQRKERDSPAPGYEAFPSQPESSGDEGGADLTSDDRPINSEGFITPTRRRSSSRRSSSTPDSPTFFKFEFELGADIPRSDAFDSPSSQKRPRASEPEVGNPPSSPAASRPPSDNGVSPMRSPRVSTRFSKRASILPPTALSMLQENSETLPAVPSVVIKHPSLLGRTRLGGTTSYPESKHAYAVRALAEYEQSLEEEHEWREKVVNDEENEGKPLADLVPRLGVSWPLSFEEG